MPTYQINGAHRDTGRDVCIALAASSRHDAEAQASEIGILVQSAMELRTEPEPPVQSYQPYQPPAVQQVMATMSASCLSSYDVKRIARAVAKGVFFGGFLLIIVLGLLSALVPALLVFLTRGAPGR